MLFAEVERDLISERIRDGLVKARASGRKLGRPRGVSRLDGKEAEIRHFLDLGVQDRGRHDHRRLPTDPLQLHEHPRGRYRHVMPYG